MVRLLDAIDSPSDLKKLSPVELPVLAKEIRDELVATVPNSGGHLASNLGVVELTIALHRVFDSPKDKLIWDVGHQSYVHKLLTGRKGRFTSLRQLNGLSGFTDRSESSHDPFGSGHASTSISAALGIATARDLNNDEYNVVAVIGDGALTGGMAYEALNHAGQIRKKVVVILNDNQMSISPTVGAITNFLNRICLDERLENAENHAERLLSRTEFGKQLLRYGKEIKRDLKSFVLPPAKIWEELGFTYMGPFDGHNLVKLEEALKQARDHSHNKPVFIHLLTTKGKGYPPAEADAVRYHGIANQQIKPTAPTFSEVFSDTLYRLMKKNPKIVAVTAAMAEGNCLGQIAFEFPSRFFDVGICEEHATTFAAGLATQGFLPVVAIYSTFMQRAFDQLIHDVCIQDLPVVIAMDRAGIVGDDGKTHQGIFDLSYLGLIPNLVVVAPKDGSDLRQLMIEATTIGHPIAIRYPRSQTPESCMPETDEKARIGQAEILRTGTDITLLAIGTMCFPALDAARILSGLDIEASVINVRYVKPFDTQVIIQACQRSGRVITIEENVLAGGFGSSLTQYLHNSGFDTIKVRCVGIPNQFVEHGPRHVLQAKLGLDASGIVRCVLESFPELQVNRPSRQEASVN